MVIIRVTPWPRFRPLFPNEDEHWRAKNIIERELDPSRVDFDLVFNILTAVKRAHQDYVAAQTTLNEESRLVWLRQRRETIPHAAEKLELLIHEHLRHLDPPLKNALRIFDIPGNRFSTGPEQPTHPVLEKVHELIALLKTNPIFQPVRVRPQHRPKCPAVQEAEKNLRKAGVTKETTLELLRLVGVKA